MSQWVVFEVEREVSAVAGYGEWDAWRARWDTVSPAWQEQVKSRGNALGFALRGFLGWQMPVLRRPTKLSEKLPLQKLRTVKLPGISLDFQDAGQGSGATDWREAISRLLPVARERAERLISRYGSRGFWASAPRDTHWMEVLTYLEWLDAFRQEVPGAFEQALMQSNQPGWLDVGAKNWAYAFALAAFIETLLKESGQPFGSYELNGVELDPHRRYLNLQTRGQVAQQTIRSLPQAAYHECNILQWQASSQVISHFLPFLFKGPHLAWGLPLEYFEPEAVLWHEISLLSPGGVLVLVNQGETEFEAQGDLLQLLAERANARVFEIGRLPTGFVPYRYPRFGWLLVKIGG